MSPYHSIDFCPICGGGLCGIRICDGCVPGTEGNETVTSKPLGLIICDECEAVWMEPDVTSEHFYLDAVDPVCPICCDSIWESSHWANSEEVKQLGWDSYVKPELDVPREDRPASHESQ